MLMGVRGWEKQAWPQNGGGGGAPGPAWPRKCVGGEQPSPKMAAGRVGEGAAQLQPHNSGREGGRDTPGLVWPQNRGYGGSTLGPAQPGNSSCWPSPKTVVGRCRDQAWPSSRVGEWESGSPRSVEEVIAV